jgi:hypothetical protein
MDLQFRCTMELQIQCAGEVGLGGMVELLFGSLVEMGMIATDTKRGHATKMGVMAK